MISERQDTLSIHNWLARWLKSGIKIPDQTVCVYSTALLGAITRAFFSGLTLRCYAEKCFRVITGHPEKLPQCYIRIDIAHMIKIFCRNKHLSGIKINRSNSFILEEYDY